MSKFKKKASELKAWYKKNEPAILVVGSTIVGVVGWGLAGYYQGKAIKAESRIAGMREQSRVRDEIDPDAWPTIKVPPKVMSDVENGATLKYRQRTDEHGTYCQSTSLDEFPAEANELFERGGYDAAFYEEGNRDA